MDRNRFIYYVAFPVVALMLCAFSYYLGWTRGRQSTDVSSLTMPEKDSEAHGVQPELTFFKTLRTTDGPTAEGPGLEPTQKPWVVAGDLEKSEAALSASYSVQVSAFRDIGKAHELIDTLKTRGFSAYTRSGTSEKTNGYYRVYVGAYDSKSQALETLEELTKKGFGKGFVTTIGKR